MNLHPQDSVITTPLNINIKGRAGGASDSLVVRPHQKTVAEVLSWLPKDATPAQQDSAVQANFISDKIVVSDSLRAARENGGTWFGTFITGANSLNSFAEVDWRAPNFVDSVPHASMRLQGVAGDPVNYALRNDEFVTTPFIISFFLAALMIGKSWKLIKQSLSQLFGRQRIKENVRTEKTGKEWNRQAYFLVFTCLLFSIFFFGYTQHFVTEVFNQVSPYKILSFYFFSLIVYYTSKLLIYRLVNNVFFEAWQIREWNETLLFYVFFIGLALMPVTLLGIFVEFDYQFLTTCLICILLFSKYLLFYRCKSIFFNKFKAFFHLILYFCTLEILPMLVLWRFLMFMNYKLITDF